MKKLNIKYELKMFLRERNIKQDELYNKTGFHFLDVKTIEDLEEVKRIIELYY